MDKKWKIKWSDKNGLQEKIFNDKILEKKQKETADKRMVEKCFRQGTILCMAAEVSAE